MKRPVLAFVTCLAGVCVAFLVLLPSCKSRVWTQEHWVRVQQEMFDRQKYTRRYQWAVQETEAYFDFTNNLARRDKEIIDLEWLGKLLVNEYGTNIAWQVVITAYHDYSNGAQLDQATNVMWLATMNPRTRDTAWMITFKDEWLK